MASWLEISLAKRSGSSRPMTMRENRRKRGTEAFYILTPNDANDVVNRGNFIFKILMTWLSGKPKKIIRLCWPANDPRIEALKKEHTYFALYPYSVFDDQILRALVQKGDNPSSTIYLARIYEAIANNDNQVTFDVCAVLPYVVHRVALLPNRIGFASLTFNEENSTITLRIHYWDGSVSKEVSTHAAAAYNRLVVQGDSIGICVSSGEESDVEFELEGFPPALCRVDYTPGSGNASTTFDEPFADEIVVWNWRTGSLNRVKIPQDSTAPLRHQGNFAFVDQAFIALGGTLSSAFGDPSALLKTFSLSGEFSRTFSHGQNFEMHHDIDVVAQSSSPIPDDILVNYHHEGSRITIVKNDLLKDHIESLPDSDDPPGLHMVWSHKNYVRTISGEVNPYLPSVCDNRVLLYFGIDNDHALADFAIDDSRNRYVLYICDFDQRRCNNVLTDRSLYKEQIKADNEDAQVTVVQRNYYVSIEDDQDMEYPSFQAPAEWREHLRKLWETGEARRKGDSDTPILEFDEGPSENPRLVFTRSLVWLPPNEYRNMDQQRLALSSCGIIYMPERDEEGHVFVFDS